MNTRAMLLLAVFLTWPCLWSADSFSLPSSSKSDLWIPSAGPSLPFLSKQRKISIRSVEWGRDSLLPLQHYRSKSSSSVTRKPDAQEDGVKTANRNEKEWLQSVLQNPLDYNLSRTSATLLESYEDLSPLQQAQLVQKIRVEQRASLPVPDSALEILYCDEHICVTNKPSGVLSVPGPRRNPSLANLVYDKLQPSGVALDQMIVHRLDMATSGIIIYALSLPALSKLHRDFKDRRVQKTYQALVEGHSVIANTEGEINVDLERDPYNPPFMRIAQPKPEEMDDDEENSLLQITADHKFYTQAAKPSLTTWTLLEQTKRYGKPVSRLQLRPWTGRTHQLRVHCAQALGAPIVGDDIYGSGPGAENAPLCLHAQTLCVCHPISGAPMMFEADAPF